MKKVFRKISAVMLTSVLSFGLFGCGEVKKAENVENKASEAVVASEALEPVAATKELNILTWAGFIPDEVIAEYENKYGVKVNLSYFGVNEEMLQKLQTQKNEYDIITCSDYIIKQMIEEGGLLDKIDWTKLENEGNIDPVFKGSFYDRADEYVIPYSSATEVIIYNKDTVKKEIKGYNDLWSEDFKDKVLLLDSDRDTIGMALMSLGYGVNETDDVKLKEAEEKLVKLLPNIHNYTLEDPITPMVNGDVDVAIVTPSFGVAIMNSGINAEFVFPEEGVFKYVDNVVLPAGGPNVENAYSFMDYIMDAKVSAQITDLINYPGCNIAAKEFISKENLENPLINIDYSKHKNVQSVQSLGADADKYSDIWTRLKAQ